MWEEFKNFAMKGNALDLAIGVIIGAAFTPIVATLVANIIMPIIGYVTAGVELLHPGRHAGRRRSRSSTGCSSTPSSSS